MRIKLKKWAVERKVRCMKHDAKVSLNWVQAALGLVLEELEKVWVWGLL